MLKDAKLLSGIGYKYTASLLSFLLFLALVLLTVVDIRRAFLFPSSSYFKIGFPSSIIHLNSYHIILLLASAIGILLSYLYLARLDRKSSGKQINLKAATTVLAITVLAFLVIDLFIYRGVPAGRALAAGKLGIGQVFYISSFPLWIQPVFSSINYLALVWHATLLGIFIGALFIITVGGLLKKLTGREGFLSHVAGSALALPHPFCSCCAAPIGAALYRSGGASAGAMLAFTVSAPMLNITSLVLAASLLPAQFAILRIAGGVVLGVLVTYAAAYISARWLVSPVKEAKNSRIVDFSSRIVNFYSRLFRFENITQEPPSNPSALLSRWLATAWHLGKVVVPVLFLGAVLTSAIVMLLPSPQNSITGILAASALGTILMIPTWTEIPVAGTLLAQGLNGPAAALLLTLPAVSIPCLLIVGGALGSNRIALLLGIFVFLAGSLVGLAFL